MTEAEWLACREPDPMLKMLPDTTTERKLRLFALACCARIDYLISDPRSRAALEFAERHVEVGINRRGVVKVRKAGHAAWRDAYGKVFEVPRNESSGRLVLSCAADAATATVNEEPLLGAGYASSFACFAIAWGLVQTSKSGANDIIADDKAPEFAEQSRLARDIFANPFRSVSFDPSWRTDTALSLARVMYETRDFSAMPILADALQEAGCEHADILDHCRSDGVHVRGCWVVDLVLGKN